MRRGTKKTLGVVLVAAGVAVVGVGVAGQVGSWGAKRTTLVVRRAPTSAGPSSGAGLNPTSTTRPPAQVAQEFLDALGAALREGNVEFLAAALDPRVIDRYGEAQCRATLAEATDGAAQFTVKQVTAPARWSWSTDSKTVDVRDAIAVDVDQVTRGVTQAATLHLGSADGHLTWFVDCGDPVGP